MGDNDPKRVNNRASLFKGDNCAYWNENMYINLMLINKYLWIEITDKPYIPNMRPIRGHKICRTLFKSFKRELKALRILKLIY